MKKIYKLLAAGCLLLAVVSLSSCLSDSDNNNSDPEKEWKEWIDAVKAEIAAAVGNYAGYVYYQPDVMVSQLDSVAVDWDIVSDSMMVLNRVPAHLLVDKMPETYADLKEAVNAMGTVSVKLKIAYNVYYKSPLLYYVYPEPVKLNVDVDGQTKAVEVDFFNTETNTQSFGQVLVSDGKCLVKLYPKTVRIDGASVKSFDSLDYAYLYWLGKKR